MNVTQQCRYSYFELGLPVVSLQYPNLVESKLNCKSKSWLPTPYRALVILLTRRLNPALSMVSPAWTFSPSRDPTLFSRLSSSHVLLTERVLLLLFVHYSNSPFAVQYYRPILRNTKQSWILDPIPWIVDSGCWIFSGTWILDSMP